MIRLLARAALLCAAATVTVSAQQPVQQDSLARQLDRLQRQLDSLRRVAERQEARLMELDERTAAAPRRAAADTIGRPRTATPGIYGKPFVGRFGAGTAVGGYVSTEFRSEYDRELGAWRSAFDQHRLVPFIFAEITDRLHFGTEIEFEHGTKLEIEDGEAEGAGEVNVEFATLDYRFTEALNLRGGVILSPLGRFNLTHDDPINELTDRPLVARQVIPGTLGETGVGFFGTIYPSARSLLTYEAYVVNGFSDELVEVEPGERRLNVREAPGTRGAGAAATKNFVGRLGFSPFLGLEIGASLHTGEYGEGVEEEGEAEEGRRATIAALDWSWRRGPFEILGEAARLRAQLPDELGAAGVSDGRTGYYVQANYRFGQGWLAPEPTSVFTGVVRWDEVDYASGVTGDEQQRLTLGLNWRPVGEAAIKGEYQWNWITPTGTTSRGPADGRVLLSLATYF
ncbi:MAG TPA: hypothetical protein VFS08_05540 [Gemmatimonadaceae bacterium]|nr:hypothetical protein [Gemmatimonadaceae bacterium]